MGEKACGLPHLARLKLQASSFNGRSKTAEPLRGAALTTPKRAWICLSFRLAATLAATLALSSRPTSPVFKSGIHHPLRHLNRTQEAKFVQRQAALGEVWARWLAGQRNK